MSESHHLQTKVGVIGCGKISDAYFRGMAMFDNLQAVACADLRPEIARGKAEEHGISALSVDQLLAEPDIEIVLNLTIPQAHAEVALAALEAGKHVYCEKPLSVDLAEGRQVIEAAHAKSLLVGCAPDTFLGASHQTCRKLLDDGWIGVPVAGTAFMMGHGPESWHPNPGFYYLPGGGPMFDMGPYYLTALINLLGPVKKVCAKTARTFEQRLATCKEHYGEHLPVEVSTHHAGVLEFHSGALITVTLSFDVWGHTHSPIEIYGTEGSMQVPDPNGFGNAVRVYRPALKAWTDMPYSHIYHENSRGIGVADLAAAIQGKRAQRCHGDMACHAVEVMSAFDQSSQTGREIEIATPCQQPEPLPMGLIPGQIERQA